MNEEEDDDDDDDDDVEFFLHTCVHIKEKLCLRRGSNPRPLDNISRALPLELTLMAAKICLP